MLMTYGVTVWNSLRAIVLDGIVFLLGFGIILDYINSIIILLHIALSNIPTFCARIQVPPFVSLQILPPFVLLQ